MDTRRTSTLWDGHWHAIRDKVAHECCSCGHTHRVEYKIEDGVLYERWTTVKKDTLETRRKRGISLTTRKP